MCLLLGVCLTIVNTAVSAPSPGTPFIATVQTRGTGERRATTVSRTLLPARASVPIPVHVLFFAVCMFMCPCAHNPEP